MKPILFRWVKTSNRSLEQLVKSDAEFKQRIEKSISELEGCLEELADKGNWEDTTRMIPYDQFVKNGILINDAGNNDRMFLFVTLNSRPAENIIESLYEERYTHVVYLDLYDSVKG